MSAPSHVSAPALHPVDPHTETFLSGRYAPIWHEIAVDHLVVDGDLPSDLHGAYLRNGPNPKYPPLGSYTYPFEGDAMIHGVWLEDGTARYANRFVETAGLRADERAGRAVFGGLMTPSAPDETSLDGAADPSYPFKLNPSIHIVRHAGRYLATAEGPPPYEVTPVLDTIGWCDFDGAIPAGIGAHPKIDAATGEMIVIRYAAQAPHLTWAVIGPDGTVTRPMTTVDGLDQGYMIHDVAITARYLVIVVGPLAFDLTAQSNGSPLTWEPELGTRIALVPRDGTAVRWVHTDAFWAWHYANAFDDDGGDDVVVVDFPSFDAPGLVVHHQPDVRRRTGFTRAVIHPDRATVDTHLLDDRGCEFPRIDDRLLGRRHRYATVIGRSTNPALAPGEHDTLLRYDTDTGQRVAQRLDAVIGEVVFAPRHDASGELDGYYLAFTTDLATNRSNLCIWDAGDFPAPPRATIAIPHRVPNGLHGSWLPAPAHEERP